MPCDRRVRGASGDGELGFERSEAAETGRPDYDPRDLLKLYLYGYLHTVRSSRCLEAECRRNVELTWLLGRLNPDHKSIAEFRRVYRDAVTAAGARTEIALGIIAYNLKRLLNLLGPARLVQQLR